MKLNQHTLEQIIKILDQAVKGEQNVAAVCREHGIAEQTVYRWCKTYGGMAVNEVQRWKELEKENSRLKRLLAERMLGHDLLKELLEKRADAGRSTHHRPVLGRGWTVHTPCLRPGTRSSVVVPVSCAPDR